MGKWQYLFDALQKGVRLADAETWKSMQLVSTLVMGVIVSGYGFGAAIGLLPDGLAIATIAETAATVGVFLYTAFSSYVTVATTKKIGKAPKSGAIPRVSDPSKLEIDSDWLHSM